MKVILTPFVDSVKMRAKTPYSRQFANAERCIIFTVRQCLNFNAKTARKQLLFNLLLVKFRCIYFCLIVSIFVWRRQHHPVLLDNPRKCH